MPARPVILVIIKGLGIGGAERLISEAIPFWDRDTFDYRVAYFVPWKNQLVPELEEANVPVAFLGGSRGMDPLSAIRLRSHIRETEAAIVHAHSPATAVVARMVSPAPIVYTEHNLGDSYRQPTRTLNKMTYSRNAAVTAVSAAVAESVAAFGGPAAAVVPNGVSVTVDPAEVSAARAELSIDEATELVVAVGNIRPHKGHQNLVETAAVLKEKRPQALVVSIGGEKYPGDLDRLKEAAEAAGVTDTIRFLGRKENAREFIAAADVFVNPSDVEGLPVVILEAMAMGRAIAATAVGGVPSVIEDGETGLLAAPGDPDGLAGAIVRLLEDPHLRTTVGAAAAAAVARDHGMAPMIEAFEDIYQRLLSG